MNNRESRRYEMFTRVRAFGQDRAADFAAGGEAAKHLARLGEIVAGLAAASAGQQGGGATAKSVLLDALRLDLQNIARTARAITQDAPGFDGRFSPPANFAQSALLTTATAYLAELRKPGVAAQFAAHELPADFASHLADDLAAIAAARDEQLPPPGTYQVQLFWQKYNVTGTAVLETGGFHTETITIVDGPNRIFTGGGDITYDDSTDEDGNNIGTGYSSDLFDIYVPVPGQLHLSSSSRFWYVLADPAWSAVATGGDASPLDIVLSVQPGVYHLWCVGTSPGAYSLSADILPYTPLPVITNTVLPSAILGVPYSVTVTADIAVNARFAGGLPLGLACNPVTGVISGTPTQAGDFNVLLWATNSAGYHGPSKKLTLSVARGNQSITFAPLPDRSNLDSVFSLTATASSGLDVTYLVVSGPATVTGRVVTLDGPAGIVTIRAMQVGNVSYNAAVPVNRSFTVSFAAPTVITHPAPQSVIAGASAMFSVTATGSAPLAYQWWKGSTALSNTGAASGATTAALTLTNVAVSDAGNYNGLASKMWTLS